jgi:zinc/manganese transport system substrate-binding protein
MRRALATLLLGTALACTAAACGTAAGDSSSASRLQVVAAEGFWGSIAAQLGGDRVQVTSVIANPAADPHDYEPTAADARALAGAKLVIVNGVGYDPWASKLLAANPVDGRIVLTVGDLAGIEAGGNPHRWYSPGDVQRVIAAVTAGYARLDPRHAASFARQKAAFETKALARYKRLIATIGRTYRGVAVGASESIFTPLAQALGLKLVTPSSFLKAISEGAEPTAADKTAIDRQIARKAIAVWVYNSQNSTPDVERITAAARRHGIPVTAMTETPSPATASFQAWQTRQLAALAAALGEAAGR